MRAYLLFLPALLGCLGNAQRNSTTPADKEKSPELSSERPWIDPEEALPSPRESKKKPRPLPPPVVIRNATVLTAAGKRIENGTVVVKDGKISAIGGASLTAPEGAIEIDGTGRFLTPGIIDAHSHLGVYPSPGVEALSDGNEAVAPVTASAAAEYGYWPQDPGITRALAGGVTVAQILPGSANLIGGLGLIVEMRPGVSPDDVKFPGAPRTIKMACGENPKRVYRNKGGPSTRMGEYAAFRAAFQEAAEYLAKRAVYAKERAVWEKRRKEAEEINSQAEAAGKKEKIKAENAPTPPAKNPKLEVLADVLAGKILVQVHCYRADEILQMVKISDEFGFSIRSFHHALEAYKVRDVLVEHDIAISTWADWWGFKMEAFDGIPENAALFSASGGRAVIHSDSEIGIQRLNQEAGKAMYAGHAAGLDISEDEALRWITANPAWVLGIEDQTGTIEVGKRGDLVLWSKNPFSVYARADLVLIHGEIVYDRLQGGLVPTDFELGNSAIRGGTP